MRRVQDNLRAINTNDGLMRTLRWRAAVASIVVSVLTVMLVVALVWCKGTGRNGVMYIIIVVVSVLVLLMESVRGVSRILRLSL
jgi:hypothetical protein